MNDERIEKSPHNFWLTTCGVDTYRRSPNHARQDTPWNAFNIDRSALVNTLWVDSIVDVNDPDEQRVRRFIKLGMQSRAWKGQAVAHGREARANLETAIKERCGVFGFETEPNQNTMEQGGRLIKHFYLDRVHQLRPVFGITGDDLKERLKIEDAFRRHNVVSNKDISVPALLFELVKPSDMIPGSIDRISNRLATVSSTDDDQEVNEDLLNEGVHNRLTAREYAKLALPLLVAHVLQQQDDVLVPITYRGLAELLERRDSNGNPWPRGLGKVLLLVTDMIDQASIALTEKPPFLTCIVVASGGQSVGLPSNGVSGQWPGYESLSIEDKRAKVLIEYDRILQFGSRWNDILRLLELPFSNPPLPLGLRERGWGGGESEAHKMLKRFILSNPHLCGAGTGDGWESQEEFALRSGDEIDVMFKSDDVWIGVEVKSHVSDNSPDDYQRGLYQVVKYKAVLEAQARLDHLSRTPLVHVILVLESKLPVQYRQIAASLDVSYLENVVPAVA